MGEVGDVPLGLRDVDMARLDHLDDPTVRERQMLLHPSVGAVGEFHPIAPRD